MPEAIDSNASVLEAMAAATSTSPSDSALGSVSKVTLAPIDIRESRQQSPDRTSNNGSELVPVPMRNLYEFTRSTGSGSVHASFSAQALPMEEDLISKGIISLEDGQQLFDQYLRNHHLLLWAGTISPYQSLETMRRSSIILSTAIFTIALLHRPDCSETLQRCYDAFVFLIANSAVTRGQNIDDIRGLCLAAFYLPNLSWRLIGQAIRMATEMNIHQSYERFLSGDTRHQDRVRLWYALYVCDRHFSTLYGRPSSMSDDVAIRGVEQFLKAPGATPGDSRISAQVTICKILSEVYLEFGSNQQQQLSEQDLDKLRIFNISIEQWRLVWQSRSVNCPGIGSYPSMGVIMFYHFARFQLNSLALRGVSWPGNEPLCWLNNRREAAMAAVSSAMATLVHILNEDDLRRHIKCIPLFTPAMIAFCVTFLLKMVIIGTRGGEDTLLRALGMGLNRGEVISLAQRSADLLTEVAGQVSEKHVTRLIEAGVRELLQRVQQEGEGFVTGSATHVAAPRTESVPRGAFPVADFATEQVGDGAYDMVCDMDLDSLVGLLEYGGCDETFLGGTFAHNTDGWGAVSSM